MKGQALAEKLLSNLLNNLPDGSSKTVSRIKLQAGSTNGLISCPDCGRGVWVLDQEFTINEQITITHLFIHGLNSGHRLNMSAEDLAYLENLEWPSNRDKKST